MKAIFASKRIVRTCKQCGVEFRLPKHRLSKGRENRGKFCSRECWGKSQVEDKNPNWKGKKYTDYSSLHKWVNKMKGTPKKCQVCGTTEASRYEWSNIDHKYSKNLNDYIRMCSKCHVSHHKLIV